MELVIFAGPNGSGKSTIVGQFIKEYHWEKYEYVNADIYAKKITEDIPEIEKYKRAFILVENKIRELTENHQDFIIETVNSTDKKYPYYKKCIECGYKLIVVFVGTSSPDINVHRVAIRKSQGGHDVPKEKIIDRYTKSMENLKSLATMADELYIFDNSTDELPPEMIFYENNGEIHLLKETQWLTKYLLDKLK